MPTCTDARRDAAAQLAARYAPYSQVTAVILAGSTGRGHADRWSDVELGVLWSTPPSVHQREAVAATATRHRLFDFDEQAAAWYDDMWLDGLLSEVVHSTVEATARRLDQLLTGDTSLLTLGAAYAYGVVLAGDATALTDRVREYPAELAAAVVRRHGQIDHFWRWQMYLERGDLHGLRTHFAQVVTALTHMLCALNRRWWTGAKWQQHTLASLAIAPPRLADRVAAVAAMAPPEAATELTALVEETYDLVAAHLPQVDTVRLREIFAFARAPWP